MKLFKCQKCGQTLYFENRNCQQCGSILGFVPGRQELLALEPVESDWSIIGDSAARYKFCQNAALDACNWLLPSDAQETMCVACRHNHTIPDLTTPDNLIRWRKFEIAKHRLFYTLIRLGLPIVTRAEDPSNGLAFDFLADAPNAPKVMTGHKNGLITINLNEADDAKREALRSQLDEPYRTLLGNFRHEIGHYYWDRLVADAGETESCRVVFGDDTVDYAAALKAYYENGPLPTWQENFVSAYATAHPWEDFAETWAHYLHIVDGLETAMAFGLQVNPPVTDDPNLSASLDFDPFESDRIDQLIGSWLPLSFALNSISRAMGGNDLYPFILSNPAIAKLGYIHDLVRKQRS